MLRAVIILSLLVVSAVFFLLLLLRLLSKSGNPGKKSMERDVEQLRQELDSMVLDLAPINKEELELFSLTQENKSVKKRITKSAKGVFSTIYHEPVAAYAYKEYLGSAAKPNGLLVARTKDHEFIYHIKKGEATLLIDKQEVGQLLPDGRLIGKRSGKEIAAIGQSDAEGKAKISVAGKNLGKLQLPSPEVARQALRERAFSLDTYQLDDRDEQLLLALSLRELVAKGL